MTTWNLHLAIVKLLAGIYFFCLQYEYVSQYLNNRGIKLENNGTFRKSWRLQRWVTRDTCQLYLLIQTMVVPVINLAVFLQSGGENNILPAAVSFEYTAKIGYCAF